MRFSVDGVDYYDESAEWERLPEHMRDSMFRYVMFGLDPGNFLTSVLANDLLCAAMKADTVNRYRLYDYVYFVYNYVPRACHGDYERVRNWKGIVDLIC